MSAGRKVVAGMLFAAIVAAASAALAEADYPNRPVTLIVPYAAGGVADVGMRILGEQLKPIGKIAQRTRLRVAEDRARRQRRPADENPERHGKRHLEPDRGGRSLEQPYQRADE